ncbi:hypothetical protein [Vagococcus salmoninarum]|uniref:hypothetical protein n=1 Tax=Vagococcus salmoninarum TaxID=2739 RepID=UPI0018824061|nr:hypothetical protein [Vagococcus salmoninarum]MBE9387873.1 hypothetical protein [Vagococcus salmoninarum]
MDIEKMAELEALKILKTKGISVTCPFCKELFVARDLLVVCPHCNKTLDVEFNVSSD